jgi:hypothetical protein
VQEDQGSKIERAVVFVIIRCFLLKKFHSKVLVLTKAGLRTFYKALARMGAQGRLLA